VRGKSVVGSRNRARLVVVTAVLLATLPGGGVAGAASSPAALPRTARTAPRPAAVTLITGDRVRVAQVGGHPRIESRPAARTGPAARLSTYRLGSDVYVMPATARPYIGRLLDRGLFDVTRRSGAARPDGRLPVRIRYTGAASPAVPGVTVTSAADGIAAGYLTADSAATFGAALAQRYAADAAAGFPRPRTLFAGVTGIASALAVSGGRAPRYPMYTLRLTATGADGRPLADAFGILMNADDGRKYNGFIDIVDGEARVSVPAGHYTMIADSYEFDRAAQTSRERLATVNEYEVTGPGQTLTVDFRAATVRAGGVVLPKPGTVQNYQFEWDRADAARTSGISWGTGAGPGYELYVAPSAPAAIGSLHVLQTWNAAGPGADPAYVLNLATQYRHVPPVLIKTFAPGDLATVRSSYFTDGPDRAAAFLRFPVYPWQFWVGGSFGDVRAPTTRTEDVAGTGSPRWGETYLTDANSWDDSGFWDSVAAPLPAGLRTDREWLRGVLAPGIPYQAAGGVCYGCRTSHRLGLALAPALDAAGHRTEIYGASDGVAVSRFRFFRNGELVSDQDDRLGGSFSVPSATATYRAVLDVDRRLTGARLASRSTTEVTFRSAAGQGGQLPTDWWCDTGDAGPATGCRVLPVVTARAVLPTNLRGEMPAGPGTVTVGVSRQQNAGTGRAASAGLEIRYPGWSWQTVPLTAAADGTWTGVIDSSGDAGQVVDVRVHGADPAGNSYTSTILKAYTVAGS
jgi:hypothetical protein